MTLSRWRRVVTGVAAGVIVLLAALIGASFRDDNRGVSIASELRPENIIPIEDDPVEQDPVDTGDDNIETTDDVSQDDEANDTGDPAGNDDETNAEAVDSTIDDTADTADEAEGDEALTEPVQVIEADDIAAADEAIESQAEEQDEPTAPADDASEEANAAPADSTADQTPQAPAPAPVETPAAPLPSTDSSLGTGGGVNDAECALDRLVIYAGARRGGVAGSIRNALAQAGFGAGCPAPVTVLASNCPLQFSGVLGAGTGYDPTKSFVAANPNVDRSTMTAVLGEIGYSGNEIDILDFGFVIPDRPGERWMAVFIPPSFDGWQNLAARAGQAPTASSLCSPSGQLAG